MRRIDALHQARMAIEGGRKKRPGRSDWVWSPDDEDRLHEQLTALETIGVVKFDEPAAPKKGHLVPVAQYATGGKALIYEDTLVETLRMIGYSVEPAPKPASASPAPKTAQQVMANALVLDNGTFRHLGAREAFHIESSLRDEGFSITRDA